MALLEKISRLPGFRSLLPKRVGDFSRFRHIEPDEDITRPPKTPPREEHISPVVLNERNNRTFKKGIALCKPEIQQAIQTANVNIEWKTDFIRLFSRLERLPHLQVMQLRPISLNLTDNELLTASPFAQQPQSVIFDPEIRFHGTSAQVFPGMSLTLGKVAAKIPKVQEKNR